MKQYVIDELRPGDFDKIKSYFDQNIPSAGLDHIYWIPLEERHFSEVQASHTDCHPLYFAAHLEDTYLACEMLVRTQNRIKCECMAYASEAQRNWLIQTIDAILAKLKINV